jgi:hypothetical protein
LTLFASVPSCLAGLDAYSSTSHRTRGLIALCHFVALIPSPYAKAKMQSGDNDAILSPLWLVSLSVGLANDRVRRVGLF